MLARTARLVVPWTQRMSRSSLLVRFSVISFVLLLVIGAGLGWLLQNQMEHTALEQQAAEVAVVVDGVLTPQVAAADLQPATGPAARTRWAALARRLLEADKHLVRIKVWNPTGRVIYSNNPRQIGEWFPVDDNLHTALTGGTAMDVSNLTEQENAGERQGYSSLLETYIPLRSAGHVVGAYEAYSDLAALEAQLNDARRILWASVAVGFLLLYASLFAIVRSASRRLVRQMQAISSLEVHAREAETLRQVDRLKDEFIGTISHELRRPLTSIKGYTASLLLPGATWDAKVQREFLQVIDEEADILAQQITNLLDLARLGSGSLPLNCEPLHLRALTEQAVHRIQAQPQLPAHTYEIRFQDDFPYVEADQERLGQVLVNLLENAAKYSPPGTPVVVEGQADAESITVRVIDRGVGLTPEQASHVFDKFYRVDSGLTRATEGTGLGLALSRGVIEAHRGTMNVDSRPGEGSTFTFTLPLTSMSTDGEIGKRGVHASA
jgi:signal transduction histidine kinase